MGECVAFPQPQRWIGGRERIEVLGRCTACEPETFFSHRRDAGRTGRQGVIAYVAG